MPLTLSKIIGIKFSDLWGRNPGGGDEKQTPKDNKPPELDKLWASFNARLSSLFGGSGGDGQKNPATKGAGVAAVILFLFAFAAWMVSGTFIVGEGQVGLVMTFGKHVDTKQPGVSWRWPFPIQRVEIVDMGQLRKLELGFRAKDKSRLPKEAQMVTSDLNVVDIQALVQYRVKNANDWVFNNGQREDVLRQVAEGAMREAVGKTKLASVRDGRDKIEREVSVLMQTVLDRYASGVQIASVSLQSVQVPDALQAAYDKIEKADQESKRLSGEASTYAADVIPKAKGVAAGLLREAETYRARVVTHAEGDTARFKLVLAEYQKAPVVTRDRMYIETMQHIFTNSSKLLVDTKGGNSAISLSLDKFMSQRDAKKPVGSSAPAATQAVDASVPTPSLKPQAKPSASAASTPNSSSLRTRETRDREVR